jgi:hypothetical protein
MKKRLVALLTTTVMLLFTASAFADSVVHIWTCELNDGKTGEDVVAASSSWLEVAKSMEGGADLEVYLEFRIAANVGDNGFNFVLIAADEKTWGTWYGSDDPDSAMQDANTAWSDVATCSGSSLWFSVEIE